jgi:hypothetical protein
MACPLDPHATLVLTALNDLNGLAQQEIIDARGTTRDRRWFLRQARPTQQSPRATGAISEFGDSIPKSRTTTCHGPPPTARPIAIVHPSPIQSAHRRWPDRRLCAIQGTTTQLVRPLPGDSPTAHTGMPALPIMPPCSPASHRGPGNGTAFGTGCFVVPRGSVDRHSHIQERDA